MLRFRGEDNYSPELSLGRSRVSRTDVPCHETLRERTKRNTVFGIISESEHTYFIFLGKTGRGCLQSGRVGQSRNATAFWPLRMIPVRPLTGIF